MGFLAEMVERRLERGRKRPYIPESVRRQKEGKKYRIPNKKIQSQQAFRSGLDHQGKDDMFSSDRRMGI